MCDIFAVRFVSYTDLRDSSLGFDDTKLDDASVDVSSSFEQDYNDIVVLVDL